MDPLALHHGVQLEGWCSSNGTPSKLGEATLDHHWIRQLGNHWNTAGSPLDSPTLRFGEGEVVGTTLGLKVLELIQDVVADPHRDLFANLFR